MILTHYSGAGNDFLIGNNQNLDFDLSQIPCLCLSAGVDGLILAENSPSTDAFMQIYNCDGSVAEMCGNGLRCFIHFLKSQGLERSVYTVDTLAGIQKGWFLQENVCVLLAPPKDLQLHMKENLHFINTGVPHAVQFVTALATVDVNKEGNRLRNSPLFAPAGTNVNFVELKGDRSIQVRTYERGVEGETLACGTGSAASALIAHKLYNLASPITVHVQSGEKLNISFNSECSEVVLAGPVRKIKDFAINDQKIIMNAL